MSNELRRFDRSAGLKFLAQVSQPLDKLLDIKKRIHYLILYSFVDSQIQHVVETMILDYSRIIPMIREVIRCAVLAGSTSRRYYMIEPWRQDEAVDGRIFWEGFQANLHEP